MSLANKIFAGVVAAGGVGTAWYMLRDQTVDSDATGDDFRPTPPPSGGMSLAERAVDILTQWIGQKGDGPKGTPGYHRSFVIDRITKGMHDDAPSLIGKAWCARAVRYAYEKAADEMGYASPFTKKLGTMGIVGDWAKKPFSDYKLSAPKIGAAMLLGKRHITLIAKILDPKTVVTVEGNHGDKVDSVKRVIKSEDTIIDVEAWALAQVKPSSAKGIVGGGLEMLGAITT